MPYIIIIIGIFFLFFILEEIAERFPKSRFHKWWRKNVVGEVDDHYPL